MAKAINQFLERFGAAIPLDIKRNRKSSQQARNMQNAKCNCCETRLSNLDKETKSFIPKYSKCSHCRQLVCRNCRDHNRCHECTLKLTIVRNPEQLMEIEKRKLLGFLKMLHYEEHIFDDWEKPYLVKQLLTRFKVYEDWDPKHYKATAEWVGASAKITEASRTRDATGSKEAERTTRTTRSREAERSARAERPTEAERTTGAERSTEVQSRPKNKKSTHKSRPETNLPMVVQQMKFERVGEHIYSLPCQRKMPFASEVEIRNIGAPAIPRQTRSMNRGVSMSLQDIPSPTYIESLDTEEMKSILKKSIDSNNILGQDELKLILQMLWTNMRKERNESGPPDPIVQQSPMRPYHSERHLNKTDNDDQFSGQTHHHSHKLSLAEHRYDFVPSEDSDYGDAGDISHFSASMGALNLLDAKEMSKKSHLPSSTSFRETVSGRPSASRYSGSKKQGPYPPKGRRVQDMRAIFEKNDGDDIGNF